MPKHDGSIPIARVYLEPKAVLAKQAEKALLEADLIIIGPGDLYTSLIPNLLVEGFAKAIAKRKGKLVCILNLMTKWGETNGFTASDFLKEALGYLKQDAFDAVLVSTTPLKDTLLSAYRAERAYPIPFDEARVRPLARVVVTGDFTLQGNIVRHDSHKLARALINL